MSRCPVPGRGAAGTPRRRRSTPCRAGLGAGWAVEPTGWSSPSRSRVTDRAPYTVAAATMTAVSSLSPALDSVTSSSRTVPTGVCGPAMPATAVVVRDPVSDTASHSRMPRAAMALGCSRTTPRRESTAEVFSRAVSVSCRGRHVRPVGLRRPNRAIDRRLGCARRIARRVARRCLGFSPQASGWAASQR